MRVPLSWLADFVDVPHGTTARELAAALVRAGLEVETITDIGYDTSGIVVGEVLEVTDLDEFNKPIRDCKVLVEAGKPPRGIVCGARNFVAGDRVAVALPGAVLPGGFEIAARRTYGRISDGMICSARELGVGDDHRGILVLPSDSPLGADAVELLHLRDTVLDIAVTPDRGYCLSIRGIAREAAIALGVGFRDPADVPPLAEPSAADPQPTAIEDPAAADRIVLRTVRGVDPSRPSPLEMQRRLFLAGLRPLSLAVDVTNYVMHEFGQPLHAFDRQRLHGPVVVRRPRPTERLVTLDHVERILHPADMLIADDSGPLSLAGTMGGLTSEVTDDTSDIVIEAAHFCAPGIAGMSRRHGLSSEASARFERGVDPTLPPVASARAVQLLVEHGCGTYAGHAEVDLRPGQPTIEMPSGLPGRVAGMPYDGDTVVRRLADVGCTVTRMPLGPPGGSAAGPEDLTVIPPSWRPDLVESYDLVEEVVRLEGYSRLPAVLPRTPAAHGLTVDQLRRRAVSRALAAAGYVEVLNHPFHGADALDALGVPTHDDRRRLVRLANPLSEHAPCLRTTLLPGLLQALQRNAGRGSSDIALYETGLVFLERPGAPAAPRPSVLGRPTAEEIAALDAALPAQPMHAAVVLAGNREPDGWWGAGRTAGWADAVEAARTVSQASGGAQLTVERADLPPWHPGRCAALSIGGRLIGHAGELHPRATAVLGLPPRTAAMELDLTALLAGQPAVVPAPRVSVFPPATRDVALVVDADVPAAEVEAALRDGAGELLEEVRLFDVFAGEQVGAGRRSLAYALRFRATDRTLTSDEATAARDAAVAEAARRTGARLRS